MPELTIEDLYLAWRQAKTALYYERRGVGLLGLAQFEAELPTRSASMKTTIQPALRRAVASGLPPTMVDRMGGPA